MTFDQAGTLSYRKISQSFVERILYDEQVIKAIGLDGYFTAVAAAAPSPGKSQNLHDKNVHLESVHQEMVLSFKKLHQFLTKEQSESLSPYYSNEQMIFGDDHSNANTQQALITTATSTTTTTLKALLQSFFAEINSPCSAKVPRNISQAEGCLFQEQHLKAHQFLSFLFSKANDLWDSARHSVVGDMSRPLTHYWIASSHNTYLTGDQWRSESSVDCYSRALRMGCRCIESKFWEVGDFDYFPNKTHHFCLVDCWDGPDGQPIIYHGRTLTSKIRFIDVLKTISEHAFATSSYPVILSVENHCSLPQQRFMALKFVEIFGDQLLTREIESVEGSSTRVEMPSPEELQRKIILKHKKLPNPKSSPPGASSHSPVSFTTSESSQESANDPNLSTSLINGLLYLEVKPGSAQWKPYFFVLSQSHKLHFFSDFSVNSNLLRRQHLLGTAASSIEEEDQEAAPLLVGDGNDEASQSLPDDFQIMPPLTHHSHQHTLHHHHQADFNANFDCSSELHFNEPWFHGRVTSGSAFGSGGSSNRGPPQGRAEAERRIHEYPKPKVDGLFLVRDSDTYIGDYSLSFWLAGQVHHARIRQKLVSNAGRSGCGLGGNNTRKYYLVEDQLFDSLYYLILHYMTNVMHAKGRYSVMLSEPVPYVPNYTGQEWYVGEMTFEAGNELLAKVPTVGAFFVRTSAKKVETSTKESNSVAATTTTTTTKYFILVFRCSPERIMNCRLREEGRLYLIFSAGPKFVDVAKLIEYYRQRPLFR